MAQSDTDIIIAGVKVQKLVRHQDTRGWLIECFREDEIEPQCIPAMSYISMTLPGVARGPHEHCAQTDYFCFMGSSTFKIYLWDNRKDSKTYKKHIVVLAEENVPTIVIVPPRVVHAYKNIGTHEGVVINFPNQLYAGEHKKEKVDEVRYENVKNSPFRIDE